MPNGLVREFVSEGGPASVQNAFRHAGFGELCGRDVADRDVVELLHQAVRELVLKVIAAIRHPSLDRLDAALLAGTLGHRKCLLCPEVEPLRVDLLACAQGSKVLESKVDTDTPHRAAGNGRFDLDAHVEEPVPLAVLREVGAVLDLGTCGKVTTLEDLELVVGDNYLGRASKPVCQRRPKRSASFCRSLQ